MKLSEIPTLSTEKLIEIAEHYEAKAKQYSARVLIVSVPDSSAFLSLRFTNARS
jgi:hypothetical protein